MTAEESETAEHRSPQREAGLAWAHPAAREIYRDDWLWVLDKPPGILSHPNPPGGKASNALIRGTYDFERELYRIEVPGERQRQVHLVHRLDLETSGLILCTFHGESAAVLKEALFHRELNKTYLALVRGIPSPARGEWKDRLEKISSGGKATVVVRRGRVNAVSRYSVVEAFPAHDCALISLEPETGRTHQLRIQSASRGHPIAGDERYGDFAWNRRLVESIGLKRMFLHAHRVRLRHPTTGHLLRLEAPLSAKLTSPLDRLRGKNSAAKPGARKR